MMHGQKTIKSFTKLSILHHINTLFPLLHDCMLIVQNSSLHGQGTLCTVFQVIFVCKTAPLESILHGTKNMEVTQWYIGTVGMVSKNSPPHCCHCLPWVQTGMWSAIITHEEDSIHLPVWSKPFKFIVLSSFISAHITMN
jgi:hypothetical protein